MAPHVPLRNQVAAIDVPDGSDREGGVRPAGWDDWRWQLRHRVRGPEGLPAGFALAEHEAAAFALPAESLPPVAITPYYLSLMAPADPRCPLRRQALPHPEDAERGVGESEDPLGERGRSPVPGVVHRYRDRAVFLVAQDCPLRCRHCNRRTRSREEFLLGDGAREAALRWLAATPQVREVILSGGDPLTLSDEALDRWLGAIRRVGHVEVVRIHARSLVTNPMRVTPELVRVLRAHGPLYVLTQFNHPREVTPEAEAACARLAEAGIPLANQSVLLRGINSDAAVLTALSRALLRNRVRPYYLFQLDPVVGAERFKTPVEAGVALVGQLRGRLSGLGIPTYALDAPGGHGKVALLPEAIVVREPGRLQVRTFTGKVVDYPDTGDPDVSCPDGFL